MPAYVNVVKECGNRGDLTNTDVSRAGEISDQPLALFQCHQTDADSELRRLCAGWPGCHSENLLALRLALIQRRISPAVFEATVGYRSPTPLFESGTEAAEHEQRDIGVPGAAEVHTMAKIIRRRPDLL
ncbi:DUF6283 family protein [Nocardia nova]|uniref:DUF6283 family protein n=1 Tax=Nocardia nova TaxID=37330 RepID=UPI0031840566